MKVEIFVADSYQELKQNINDWIECIKDVNITSIQFNQNKPIAYITYETSHLDSEI
jgi:hypothetical protein